MLKQPTFRMTHMRAHRLSQGMRVSSCQRPGSEYRRKAPEPDQFVKNFRRDMVTEYTVSEEVANWVPPSASKLASMSFKYLFTMRGDSLC